MSKVVSRKRSSSILASTVFMSEADNVGPRKSTLGSRPRRESTWPLEEGASKEDAPRSWASVKASLKIFKTLASSLPCCSCWSTRLAKSSAACHRHLAVKNLILCLLHSSLFWPSSFFLNATRLASAEDRGAERLSRPGWLFRRDKSAASQGGVSKGRLELGQKDGARTWTWARPCWLDGVHGEDEFKIQDVQVEEFFSKLEMPFRPRKWEVRTPKLKPNTVTLDKALEDFNFD